jgi:hypothetical protein
MMDETKPSGQIYMQNKKKINYDPTPVRKKKNYFENKIFK